MYFNNAYFILLVVSTEIWCHFTCCCHVQGDNSLKKKKLLILTLTQKDWNIEQKNHNNQELSSLLLLLLLFYSSNQTTHVSHTLWNSAEGIFEIPRKKCHIHRKKPPWQFLKCFYRNILKLIINMAILI